MPMDAVFFVGIGRQADTWCLQMLTWNSHHIEERVKDASAAVKELQELLALVQGTTRQATDLAADWAAHSLIELKERQVGRPVPFPQLTCFRTCHECTVFGGKDVFYTSLYLGPSFHFQTLPAEQHVKVALILSQRCLLHRCTHLQSSKHSVRHV